MKTYRQASIISSASASVEADYDEDISDLQDEEAANSDTDRDDSETDRDTQPPSAPAVSPSDSPASGIAALEDLLRATGINIASSHLARLLLDEADIVPAPNAKGSGQTGVKGKEKEKKDTGWKPFKLL